jgi:putative copper export protein
MNPALLENLVLPAVKFLTLLGLVWLWAGLWQSPLLRWLGLGLLLLTTLGELGLTVYRTLDTWSLAQSWAYILETRHGGFLAVRLLAIGLLLFIWRWRTVAYGLALVAAVTVSLTSHLGATGWLPVLVDAVHLLAMMIWLAALWGIVADNKVTPTQVSQIGLWTVGVLALTGLAQSVLRLWSPDLLLETSYGLALTQKLLLVGMVLLVAAINRWVVASNRVTLLALRPLVGLEFVGLLGVLWLTSVLSLSSPPERGYFLLEPIVLSGKQNVWTLQGQARALAVGGIRVDFRVLGETGYQLNKDSRIEFVLLPQSGAIRRVVLPVQEVGINQFRAEAWLGEAGNFLLELRVPGGVWRFPARVGELAESKQK